MSRTPSSVLEFRGLPVPYITPWSTEVMTVPSLTLRPGPRGPRLGYVDELHDRDAGGALYVRQAHAPGRGVPDFRAVHALRHRRACTDLLCQVCRRDLLATSPDRQLYLLRDVGDLREGELVTTPPICPPCAIESTKLCPRLRGGAAAAWVEQPQLWGVAGIMCDPITLEIEQAPEDAPAARISYEDPLLDWIIATQVVTKLVGVTPVDLADLSTLT
ncbi:hypothetical protein ACH41E_33500 [Streptomyces sp. NPDC020412]|uniref:hypothetical protein n=1 Tax=Streptomyces sp. NPDC020412 TaxID=3365073 RepID=UPI0037931329